MRKGWWWLAIGVAGACGGGGELPPNNQSCDVEYAPQLCPPQHCGDNFRNVCFETPSTGYGYCTNLTIREPCDGLDLGGATCQGFGYASGTLRCSPRCDGFDTSGCGGCLASPPPSVV